MHFIVFLMKKLITSIAALHMDEDGILIVEMLPGANVTLENNREYLAATNQLLNGRKALVLFDASVQYSITEEAKAFGTSEAFLSNRIAIAYVTRSVANKLMFNLYLTVYKPMVPAKMFSTRKSALKWLKSFYIMPGQKFVKPQKK